LAARGEILGFSHADMQCDAGDLFVAYRRLLAAREPTRTLVKGRRSNRGFGATVVTIGMTVFASAVLRCRLSDINAQPKVFHRSHLERLAHPPDGFQFDVYVLYAALAAGLTIVTIPVDFPERAHGQSR